MQLSVKNILVSLLLFFIFSSLSVAQIENIRFEKISIEDGLSQNSITSVFQDSDGYMWFGTLDGLNRYDGYDIRIYRNSITKSNSIADNYINVIFEDSKKRLWIGTRSNGLCLFDKVNNTFTTFKHQDGNPNSLCDNNVQTIAEGKDHSLWIGTAKGLCNFTFETQKYISYFHNPQKINSLASDEINKVAELDDGNLWIATNKGLNRFNIEENKFYLYQPQSENAEATDFKINTFFKDKRNIIWYGTNNGLYRLKYDENENIAKFLCSNNADDKQCNQITSITEDNTGILWIGTENNGLIKFNPLTGKSTRYMKNNNDPFSLSSNKITTIYFDRSNILWIGTNLDGLNKWDKANEGIELYRINPYTSNKLSSNKIRAIYEDKAGNIWLGTVDGGANRWNLRTGKFKHILNQKDKESAGAHIRAICEDDKGNIWMGAEVGGLYILNPLNDQYIQITHQPEMQTSLAGNSVWSIFLDSNKQIWVGCYEGGLGLLKERKGNKLIFRNFKADGKANSLTDNRVTTIFEDSKKRLWIGTFGGGLNLFNPTDSTFKSYRYNSLDTNSLGNDRIYSIMEDKQGVLWIGTKGSLNKFNAQTGKFTRYTETTGLPNDVIMGILEDESGNLWLSTNKGISKFNKQKNLFINYDIKKGLQSNEFLVGSYLKANDGKLYFGGVNGFNAFYPDSVKNNEIPPKVLIYNFKISNKDILPNDESGILDRHVSQTKEILLNYNQNSFTFEFVALHYSQPLNNKYEYILENQEKIWNTAKANQRVATYTNLKPGTYIFRVKAANSDGVWSEEVTSTVIIIKPPFWGTWWFRTLSVIFILGSAYGWYRSRINNIERQKRILEQQVKERTAEVEAQKVEIMKQAEQLEKLSIVASETDNAVMITDAKGNFEWINEGFTRMFEYNFDQLVSEVSENIIGPKTIPEVKEKIEICLHQKQTISYELLTETRSGRSIWVQTTLTPILDKDGNISKIVAIDSDIDSIKKAEKEITVQNIQIQQQNENIKGSIRYAQTIQKAILPLESRIESFFESFILYLPKDIVSGDFYWFTAINKKDNSIDAKSENAAIEIQNGFSHLPDNTLIFLAVADCTGHGVPGAFMSMIGNRLLNEIVNENKIFSPSKILTTLDEKVKKALKQEQTDNNDGMDVCLCCIEKMDNQTINVVFCGAKRPLFYYNSFANELVTFSGDRKSIGGIRTKRSLLEFSNTEFTVKKGDSIYLTSDGLIDQPSPDRKRFSTKLFTQVLTENIQRSMTEQGIALKSALDAYQEGGDQRDDITVLGIKIV